MDLMLGDMKVDTTRITLAFDSASVELSDDLKSINLAEHSVSYRSGDVVIFGKALPYDVETEFMPGKATVKVDKAAFRENGRDTLMLVEHDRRNVYARMSMGTMHTWNEGNDLMYAANIGNPDESPHAKEMAYRIGRGDLSQVSASFEVPKSSWKDPQKMFADRPHLVEGGLTRYHFLRADLREISLTGLGQYGTATTVNRWEEPEFAMTEVNEEEEREIRLRKIAIARAKLLVV